MNATPTTRFLEIMRSQQAALTNGRNDVEPLDDAITVSSATTVDAPAQNVPVVAAMAPSHCADVEQPVAHVEAGENEKRTALFAEDPEDGLQDDARPEAETWVHVKPRTAAQNAGGRTPKEIVDTMLRDSEELGEPVVLRLPVTPEFAEYLLALNPDNRKIKQETLEKYIGDMESGRWQENGEGIAISDTGLMNNGQHRTTAITMCGITQVMNVTVGVTRESRSTTDIGVVKKPGDHLGMAGHSSGHTLGAIARAIISYETANGESIGITKKVTITHIQARIATDQALIDATSYSVKNQTGMRKHVTGTTLGLVRYLTHAIDPQASDRYLEGFLSGTENGRGLDLNDPRYRARETIMKMIKKGNVQDRTEVMLRGWNRWRQGRTAEHNIQVTGRLPQLV